MRKLRFICIAVILLAVLPYLLQKVKLSFNQALSQTATRPPIDPKKLRKVLDMTALLSAPVEKQYLDAAKPQPSVDESQCRFFREKIVMMSSSEMYKNIHNHELQFKSECKKFEPETKWSQEFYNACLPITADVRSCDIAASRYKDNWTDLLTLDQTDFLEMPLSLLAKKIVTVFEKEKSREDAERLWAMAEALVTREPEYVDGHIALILSIPEGHAEERTAAVDRALEMFPEVPKVQSMYLFEAYKQQNLAAIEEFISKNSESAEAIYYYAATLWSANRKDEARDLLKKATELDPQNKKYKDSVQFMQTTGMMKTISPSFSLGFGD